MKSEHRIISVSIFFAVTVWFIDGLVMRPFLQQERYVLGYSLLDMRILTFMCFVFLGAIAAYMIAARRRVEAELRSSREQLREFATYLQAIREEERTRIAREVHDQLGQTLTALKMDLSCLSKQLPRKHRTLLDRTQSMSELIDAAIQTVQEICRELRPSILDDFGLPAAVEWETRKFQNRTEIAAEVHVDQGIVADKDLATAVFRILQETLTNVARHAGATKLEVRLEAGVGNLALTVKDNGRGISAGAVVSPKSLGLAGMRERAYSFGGQMEVEGRAGNGTMVTVRFPLNGIGR